MAKIPFTLDAWLKDKSQRVETRDGSHVVETISVDLTRDNMRVMANFGDNRIVHYYDDGRFWKNANSDNDLFIVTPEQELSEFELKVREILYSDKPEYSASEPESWKLAASELLDLARKEALKDLPRWRKHSTTDNSHFYLQFHDRALGNRDGIIIYNGYEIRLSDLEKLPGFKED